MGLIGGNFYGDVAPRHPACGGCGESRTRLVTAAKSPVPEIEVVISITERHTSAAVSSMKLTAIGAKEAKRVTLPLAVTLLKSGT
jgi:hypothetical protein